MEEAFENYEGKLEDARYQHFLLFPQCFSTLNEICIPLSRIKILMIVFDRTKLKIERSCGLLSQSQCYSDYKSSTTLKAKVGVDPRGSLIFILMLFSESISDKKITNC